VNVPLGEGELNTICQKLFINPKIQIADQLPLFVQQGSAPCAKLEAKSVIAEFHQSDAGDRSFQNVGILRGNLQ